MSCTRETVSYKLNSYPSARYIQRPSLTTKNNCEAACIRDLDCEGWLFYADNKCKHGYHITDKLEFNETGATFGYVGCNKQFSFKGVAMFIFIIAILIILWILFSCKAETLWWKVPK